MLYCTVHTHKSSDEATAVDSSEDLCVHSTVEFTPTVYTEHLRGIIFYSFPL